MRSAEQILLLYRDRKAKYAPLHAKMRTIADIYNGRAEIPLPDMDRDEMPSVPNLLQQGVDQMAGRITSVIPQVMFSSTKPGIRTYDRRALAAADTLTGWWQGDRLPLKMKTRGRRLIAYAMAPVVIRWDYKEHRPKWQVRHPLETFPSLDLQPGQVRPSGLHLRVHADHRLAASTPGTAEVWRLVGNGAAGNVGRDTLVHLIEYIDADHSVLMAAGHYQSDYYSGDLRGRRGQRAACRRAGGLPEPR